MDFPRMDEMDEVNDGWWAGLDDEQRLDHAVLDLGGLRDLFGDDNDIGVFHEFGHGLVPGGAVNEWNENAQLQRQRIVQISQKIPSIILQESPTVQMYLAIQTNNADKLKEAISKGAALVNEFQSYRLLDMHPWRGNRGDNGNQDENRNPRKNPLEYSLDCVTMNTMRERVNSLQEFKESVFNQTAKYLFINYPEFITKKYVKKLTVFIDYAVSVLRQNRRNQQAAQAAAVGVGNNNGNREARNQLLNLKLTDLFDEKFFEDYSSQQKMKCIHQLYESMFFPVEMKNIRHLDYFIDNGIEIGTYEADNGWGEKQTLTESALIDFLLKVKAAANYVYGRTQLGNGQGFRHPRNFSRVNRTAGTDWPSEHRDLFLANYKLPIKKLMKHNISMDIEIKEFRIHYRSDTFVNHATYILVRNFQKQEEIRHRLSDIYQTSQANLAKLQDDYLKLSEINRLVGNAIEGVLENNIRLGLKLGNYKFAILLAAMGQFGILHHNQHIRKELILDLVLRARNEKKVEDKHSNEDLVEKLIAPDVD